jgi:esterase/lipase superfamily enzyme
MSLMFRIGAALSVLLLLSGCAYRPDSQVLQPIGSVPATTKKVRILVATTRERGSAADPNAFTAARAKQLNYAALTISIPKHHVPGEIEWPGHAAPDPAHHFVTTDRQFLKATQFDEEIRRRAHQGGSEANSVLVFIHGYNTLYEEAVYWMAQIVHDSGFKGTAVLFAWPSMGKAPMYVADREASTYSRDYLEQALLQISRLPEVHDLNILAHSMGNWVFVETLRQATMNGRGDFNGKLKDVILASPDLDVTVFRTQLDVIGRRPRPITILTAGDDQALKLSTLLGGGVDRAGRITADDPRVLAAAQNYNLQIVDLTGVDDGEGNHHSKYSKSAPIIAAIGNRLKKDEKAPQAVQSGVITAVTDVGKGILKVPSAILNP